MRIWRRCPLRDQWHCTLCGRGCGGGRHLREDRSLFDWGFVFEGEGWVWGVGTVLREGCRCLLFLKES